MSEQWQTVYKALFREGKRDKTKIKKVKVARLSKEERNKIVGE